MKQDAGGKIMLVFESGSLEWVNAWRGRFLEEELDLWGGHSIAASEDWADRFDQSLDAARVVVVVLSEKFLHSEYQRHQRTWRAMEKSNDEGRRFVLAVVERCPWESIEQFRMIASREDRSRVVDLSALDRLQQEEAWMNLAEELRTQPPPTEEPEPADDYRQHWVPFSRVERYSLEEGPRQLLQIGAELARRQGRGLLPLSTSCLLFAAGSLANTKPPMLGEAGNFVFGYIHDRATATLESVAEKFFLFHINLAAKENSRISDADRIRTEQSMTPNVEAVLKLAVELARTTTGDETVGSRHLLAALLCAGEHPVGARTRIEEVGIDATDFRQAFFKFVTAVHPKDKVERWDSLLIGQPLPKTSKSRKKAARLPSEAAVNRPAQTPSPTPRPPLPGVLLAGFDADFWRSDRTGTESNRDLLDIKDEVNALASLAAAWSVEPPLSIGLFGDWGSGKTFFMRKMMDRVEELASAARDSGKPQREIAFYKNIVQIEFNAWHYVEGNLWASLVEHIFSNLRLSKQEPESAVQERQTKLMREINLEEELKHRSQRKREAAVQRADAASKLLVRKRDEAVAIKQQDIWDAQGVPETMRNLVRERLKELGFTDSTTQSSEQLNDALRAATSLWGRLKVQWSLARKEPLHARTILWAVVGLVAVAVLPMLLSWISSLFGQETISAAAKTISGALGLLGSAAGWLQGYTKKASDKLAVIENLREAAEQEKASQLSKINAQINTAEQEVFEANQEIARHDTRIAQLQEESQATTTDRLLAEFLENRASSEDYRRHLGVLAVIRRDFEKLSRLVADQREEEREGREPPNDPTRINRIILYIDDLDRCPAHKVVEVLQAIHLLLAFPLFVVVVGVDARWVSRSLEKTYLTLLNPPDGERRENEGERLPGHGATPRDYLEKIFQIPFWIRPMQAADCEKLLAGLTEDSRPKPAGATTPRAETQRNVETENAPRSMAEARRENLPVDQLSASGTKSEQTKSEKPASPPVPIQKPASDRAAALTGRDQQRPKGSREQKPVELTPRTLTLEDWEIDFMNELTSVLTRSPRSVKRFINCYRLIKAHLRAEEVAAFVGDRSQPGNFQPVMLLLAMLNGTPAIADKFIDRLINPSPLVPLNELLSIIELSLADQGKHAWDLFKRAVHQYTENPNHPLRQRRLTARMLFEELSAFDVLREREMEGDQWRYLDMFSQRMDRYALTDLVNELNADAELASRAEWSRVRELVARQTAKSESWNELQPLRQAAPFVARFSFRVVEFKSEATNASKAEAGAVPKPV